MCVSVYNHLPKLGALASVSSRMIFDVKLFHVSRNA